MIELIEFLPDLVSEDTIKYGLAPRAGNFITAADELLKVIYLLKRYDFNALLNSFSPSTFHTIAVIFCILYVPIETLYPHYIPIIL